MKGLKLAASFMFVLMILLPWQVHSDGHSTDSAQSHSVRFESAWVRLLPPTVKTTAGYMKIEAPAGDKLLGASSPASHKVELHLSAMKDGVMSMSEVPELEIPSREKVELNPGGYHLMIMGLKTPLKEGEKFPLTLYFEQAGAVDLTATVKAP